jgi:predicted PurR-regulated permease PerM
MGFMDDPRSVLVATPETQADGTAAPRTRIELPWPTVVKAILILVGAAVAMQLLGLLVPVILIMLETLLVTAALTPPVHWLTNRGLPRGGAVAVVFIAIIAVIGVVSTIIAPQVVDEGTAMAKRLPSYVDQSQDILRHFPTLNRRAHLEAAKAAADPASIPPLVITPGAAMISSATNIFAVIVMAIYLLAGGERSFSYALHFLTPKLRGKILSAAPEVVQVVSGYVFGQAIMSTLIATFSFIFLEIVGAPQPLLMAILAGMLDAIPVVGTLIATAVATLLALSVSPTIALVTLVAFSIYNVLESNVILPHVYGRMLGISPFSVLVAILVGFHLLGIVGIFLALPIAAAIPGAERAWRKEDLLIGAGNHRNAT